MSFSTSFKSSTKPGKQRSYIHNAPLHIRGALFGCHLSRELRSKLGTRALRVRTGDKVVVLTGQFRKKAGKVERVDTRRIRVYVSGIELSRMDGRKVPYPLRPSSLIITELADEKRRLPVKASEQKAATQKQTTTKVAPAKVPAQQKQPQQKPAAQPMKQHTQPAPTAMHAKAKGGSQ